MHHGSCFVDLVIKDPMVQVKLKTNASNISYYIFYAEGKKGRRSINPGNLHQAICRALQEWEGMGKKEMPR